MKNVTGTFKGRENRELFYQYWMPEGECKAFLIAFHDLGTYSDRLQIPAEYLTEKGYGIYIFDLRGHGKNRGNNPGHIDSIDHIQKDLVLFLESIKNEVDGKKLFLMGESFGGLIALNYAINRPQLDGIIVLSPLIDLALDEGFGKKALKKFKKITNPQHMEIFNLDKKLLTSDLKLLKQFLADKKALKKLSSLTLAEMNEVLNWVKKNLSNLACPILFLQAGNDKLVDVPKTRKLFSKIKSEDKSYKEYDGYLHSLLFEKMRIQVYQDIFVWLEKHK